MAVLNRSNRTGPPYARQAAVLAGVLAIASLPTQSPGAQVAQTGAPQIGAGFLWSADVLSSDFRSDTLDLTGNVRLRQGALSIEAQNATARDFRSPNSRWTFEEAVHIRTAEADLQSSSASASVVNGEITATRVQGSPAVFEQRGGQAGTEVRGRAGIIEYDFAAGVVTLTQDVWFSNGTDEFRGDVVIYHVRDERIQINPAGTSPGRVRGIIRPREDQDAPQTRHRQPEPRLRPGAPGNAGA